MQLIVISYKGILIGVPYKSMRVEEIQVTNKGTWNEWLLRVADRNM